MKITFAVPVPRPSPGYAGPGGRFARMRSITASAAGRAGGRLRRGLGPAPAVLDEQQGSGPVQHRRGRRCLLRRLPPSARWCAWTTPAWRCRWPNTCATRSSATSASSTSTRPAWRQGQWPSASRACGRLLPVGVMGLGVLGERVAQALAQFEFPVNGWSRSANPSLPSTAVRALRRRAGAVACLSGGQPRAGQPAAAHGRTQDILNPTP